MLRALVVIGMTLFAVDAADGFARASDSICSQTCPDDGPDGTCPPGCNDCTCCAHINPVLTVSFVVETAQPVAQTAVVLVSALPPSPEPKDILHIPKSLLA